MSWKYVEFEYPNPVLLNKFIAWVNTDCHVYFAVKLNNTDDWEYYSAPDTSHNLALKVLTLATSETEAQTNYWNAQKDSVGMILAVLPTNKQIKYARMYVETGSSIQIYEFRPSVYMVANEIISGTLHITDELAETPLIKITKSSVDRLKIGNFASTYYGVIGYNSSGNRIFELSDNEQVIAGFNFTDTQIASSDYVPGDFGKGLKISTTEAVFGNVVVRGIIKSSVFEKGTVSAINGRIVVTESDVLASDMTADGTTLTISGGTTFSVNDVLNIKSGVDDEWLLVTDASSAPTYTVTRDLAGSYPSAVNPAWSKGTAIISTGTTGGGFIQMESTDLNTRISVFKRNSTTWGDFAEVIRLGNLNEFLGYSSQLYGIGIGDDISYLKYDPTNGMRIRGQIDASSIVGGTIIGSEISTASTGRRIQITSDGIALITGAALGKYGEFLYSKAEYGSGVLAWINNVAKEIPFYVNEATSKADFHFYNRGSDPTGAAEIGDVCVVSGQIKACTAAGTPGEWTVVGWESYAAANQILYSSAARIATPLTVGASQIVGRKATGDIVALTAIEVRTIIGANGYIYYASDYASIAAAITAISTTPATLVIDKSCTLTASAVFPATLRVFAAKGGMIVKASTYTCTINGGFEACESDQVFSGFATTDVTMPNVGVAYPEWWGSVGDGSATDTTAVQCTLDSQARRICFIRNYKCGALTGSTYIKEMFGGGTLTQAAANTSLLSFTSAVDLDITHLRFVGVAGAYSVSGNTAITLITCTNVHVEKNYFTGWRQAALISSGGTDIFTERNRVYSCTHGIKYSGVNGGSISRNVLSNGQLTTELTIPITLDSTDGHAYGVCYNIDVEGNTVKDWPWVQAILGHAGVRIAITGNNFYNVLAGVSFNAYNATDTINFVSVQGNNIDCLSSAGDVTDPGTAIVVSGYDTDHKALNISITGNNTRYGNVTTQDVNIGAISVANTQIATVTGNNIFGPWSNGIILVGANLVITITGNNIVSVSAGDSGSQNGIKLYTDQGSIRISDNQLYNVSYGVRFETATYTGVEACDNQFASIGAANYSGYAQSGITVTPTP